MAAAGQSRSYIQDEMCIVILLHTHGCCFLDEVTWLCSPHLQDKEASAGKAHTAACDALQQGSASLAAAMEATVGQGQNMLAGVQQHAQAASQQLEEHVGAVAAGVQQQVQGIAELRDAQQQLCSAGLWLSEGLQVSLGFRLRPLAAPHCRGWLLWW